MTLDDLLAQGRLRRRSIRKEEIQGTLQVADRDLKDAVVPGLSSDRLFIIAYEAVLTLASIPIRCAGYETHGQGHHWTTFQAMPLTMGDELQDLSDYFESCRNKRNVGSYDRSGGISRSEASRAHRGEGVQRDGDEGLRDKFPSCLTERDRPARGACEVVPPELSYRVSCPIPFWGCWRGGLQPPSSRPQDRHLP
jgi:hypothetical protein